MEKEEIFCYVDIERWTEMEKREKLINDIIDIEWLMLENINASNSTSCQQKPNTFRLMRWMSHSVLSDELLESYLDDLKQALVDNRNFMFEKYARMENIIPTINNNSLIKEIVKIESKWTEELVKYPSLLEKDTKGFENYFACELETFSNRTIELFYKTVKKAQAENKNLVEERYKNLFKRLGYKSIEEGMSKVTNI